MHVLFEVYDELKVKFCGFVVILLIDFSVLVLNVTSQTMFNIMVISPNRMRKFLRKYNLFMREATLKFCFLPKFL